MVASTVFFRVDATFTNSFMKYKHMCLARGMMPMSHSTFQLEVYHSFMEILLPVDYINLREKSNRGTSGIGITNSKAASRSTIPTCNATICPDMIDDVPLSQELVTLDPVVVGPVPTVAVERRPWRPNRRIRPPGAHLGVHQC
jgi:hypothetical protein